MQLILTHRSVRSTVLTALTAGLLAVPAVQAAPTDCSITTPQHLSVGPEVRPMSRADAMVQGAALTAPETAAVALALFGLALLPAVRRRPARPTASP